MGNGLAALMGALGGTASLPEGMIAADKQRTADEHLAETKRHTQVLEGQLNTPLGTLYDTLGLPTPQGVDPTKSVPTSLLPHAYGALEKEEARKATEARRSILDQALERAATDFGTKTPAVERPEAAMYSESPDATSSPATITPHPGISFLRSIMPGSDPDKIQSSATEIIKELNPGGQGGVPHFLQDGQFVAVTDKRSGRPLGPPQATGLSAPEGKGPFQREDIENALIERGWKKGEHGWAEAYANVARQIPVSGVGAFGAGQFVIPPPPRTAPAAPPKAPVSPAGGLPAAPLVGAQQPLPATQTEELAGFRTLKGQLDAIEQKINPAYMGPVQGRLGALRSATGIGATQEEADIRASLAQVQNTILYLRSGKQINEKEFERFMSELPGVNDPETVFRAKLERTRQLMDVTVKNREAEFTARGFRGGAPAAPAAPSGVVKWGRDAQGRPVRLQ